jgi:hypothetical protein
MLGLEYPDATSSLSTFQSGFRHERRWAATNRAKLLACHRHYLNRNKAESSWGKVFSDVFTLSEGSQKCGTVIHCTMLLALDVKTNRG